MIREANKKDLEKINTLGQDLVLNFQNTYDINSYIDDYNHIVLVYEKEEVNAFLLVLKNINSYEIEGIVVDKEKREKGIGTKLLSYFLEKYPKKGDEIFLEVAVNNEKAIILYKYFDFEIINIRKKYYNNIDAYIMKKVIK